jgi:hypothetical protein
MEATLIYLAVLGLFSSLAREEGQTHAPTVSPGRDQSGPRWTLDTPIETIASHERGRKILELNMPGMLQHPSYPSFKGMSLKAVQPFSEGRLSDQLLRKVEAELREATGPTRE